MGKVKLWCLYQKSSSHLVKALSFDEARAICSQFRMGDLADWFVWQEDWENWRPLTSSREFFEPSGRRLSHSIPAFPDSVPPHYGSAGQLQEFKGKPKQQLAIASQSDELENISEVGEATIWPTGTSEERDSERAKRKQSAATKQREKDQSKLKQKAAQNEVPKVFEKTNQPNGRHLSREKLRATEKKKNIKSEEKAVAIATEVIPKRAKPIAKIINPAVKIKETSTAVKGLSQENLLLGSGESMYEELGSPEPQPSSIVETGQIEVVVEPDHPGDQDILNELEPVAGDVTRENKTRTQNDSASSFQSKDLTSLGAAEEDNSEAVELTTLFRQSPTVDEALDVKVVSEVEVLAPAEDGPPAGVVDLGEDQNDDIDAESSVIEFHRSSKPQGEEDAALNESSLNYLEADPTLGETSFGPVKKTQGPEEMASREFIVRHYNRYPVVMKVDIESEGRQFQTDSVDLSVGGIRLRDPLPSWIVGYCKLRLAKYESDELVDLTCYIVEGQEPNARYRVALLQLQNIEDEVSLEEWLASGAEPLSA